MAISPKPKQQKRNVQETSEIKEKAIKSLIEKGGGVAGVDSNVKKKDITNISLRVPVDIARRISDVIAERPFKTPRNTWILEAILEKLEREEKSS